MGRSVGKVVIVWLEWRAQGWDWWGEGELGRMGDGGIGDGMDWMR